MVKVKRSKVKPHPHWEIHNTINIEGKGELAPGYEFTIRGKRGRLLFTRAVTNTQTGDTWIDAHDKDGRARSLDPSQVGRVFWDDFRLRRSS